jgi:hypothetical protein
MAAALSAFTNVVTDWLAKNSVEFETPVVEFYESQPIAAERSLLLA